MDSEKWQKNARIVSNVTNSSTIFVKPTPCVGLTKMVDELVTFQANYYQISFFFSYLTRYSFNIVETSTNLKVPLSSVQAELTRLQKQLHEVSYEMKDKAFCVRILRNAIDVDDLCDEMMLKIKALEVSRVGKVDMIYTTMKSVAFREFSAVGDIDHFASRGKTIRCWLTMLIIVLF